MQKHLHIAFKHSECTFTKRQDVGQKESGKNDPLVNWTFKSYLHPWTSQRSSRLYYSTENMEKSNFSIKICFIFSANNDQSFVCIKVLLIVPES